MNEQPQFPNAPQMPTADVAAPQITEEQANEALKAINRQRRQKMIDRGLAAVILAAMYSAPALIAYQLTEMNLGEAFLAWFGVLVAGRLIVRGGRDNG